MIDPFSDAVKHRREQVEQIKRAAGQGRLGYSLPFGLAVISYCQQASGAPVIDSATTVDENGHKYDSYAILGPRAWLTPRHERDTQLALVVGINERFIPGPVKALGFALRTHTRRHRSSATVAAYGQTHKVST